MAMDTISTSAATTEDVQVKRRAACDECRTRKLKCSGEQPSCSRCVKEGLNCLYSPQKQMGRPKKRQRSDEAFNEEHVMGEAPFEEQNEYQSLDGQWHIQPNDPVNNTFAPNGSSLHANPNYVDAAFTPEGSLQPWMLPANFNWDVSPPANLAAENTIPGLTPDISSHNSPPNQPLNIQDPLPTCACLSTLYLTLSNLATMDPSFSFPTSLRPLRSAMTTATEVIDCTVCPKQFITGLQNVQLLNALLMSLADRFARLLSSINTEASALESHNAAHADEPSLQKTKSFRVADLSTPGHMHTGGPDCAASFSLSLSPAEWRSMANKVLRAEVYGPVDGNECCPFLLGLITRMEKRQDRWHAAPPPQDYPRDKDGNPMSRRLQPVGPADEGGSCGKEKGEHLCLKMLAGTRRMVEGFDWA